MLNPNFGNKNTDRDPVSKLIFELSKLPGIGEKTATRLAYHVLKQDESYARALSEALMDAKRKIRLCTECFTFTDNVPCRICASSSRDHGLICVVERPSDVFSIEQSGGFKGVYHVLHGALSPLDGIGPEELKVRELLGRLARTPYGSAQSREIQAGQNPAGCRDDHPSQEGSHDPAEVRELILATNPSVEGEATALYLARLIKPLGVRLTKLASGLPVGGMIEYTDRQTLGRAIENRLEMA